MSPHRAALLPGLFFCFALASEQDVRVGEEAVIGAHVADLQWLGEDKKVVLLQTHLGHLHRSVDGGETWVDIRNKMNKSSKPLIPSMSMHASIRRMIRSPADSNVIFAQGAGDDSFISADAGLTWERIPLQIHVQGFSFHSSRPKWFLLSYWSYSCMDVKNKEPCSHNLYITKDLGKSFSLVCSHIVQFSWGKHQFSQSDRVYFTHFVDKKTNQKRLTRWMPGIDFAFTDDFGETVNARVSDGNKFQISYNYILVVKVTNPVKQNVSLMISSDGGARFDAAKLPHRIWQHSFALLDASEGALVLHVNQGPNIGDIYISDRTGKRFTMSLSRNLRSGGLCAFEKVMNLNGIYISNVYEKYSETRSPSSKKEEQEDIEASSTDTQLDAMRSFRSRRLDMPRAEQDGGSPTWDDSPDGAEGVAELSQTERRLSERTGRAGSFARQGGSRRLAAAPAGSYVRTVVSFDAGGAWQYLAPPTTDSNGNPIQCDPTNCWLHLHDFTEIPTFSPVYSYRNAVGIIMGSGNVGPYLSPRREDANTYLSRDGGMTWVEVHKGTFIYEFGNHGGLIVMADMVQATTEALFSWDEGSTWHKFQIAEKPLRVENVIIEPEAMSTKFLLYGDRNRAGLTKSIDFDKVHKRTCQGVGSAGTDASDYEKWTVPCILGHQGVYVRRKQLSQCFNTETTERHRSRKVCKCTKSSYECSLGFARKVGSLDCYLDNPRVLPRASAMGCPAAGTFAVRAYRKVPGDVCQGGWKPRPVMLPCPTLSSAVEEAESSEGGGSLPVKAVLIIATVFVGFCLFRSERFHAWLKSLVGDSYSNFPQGPSAREHTGGGSQIGRSSAATGEAEMVGLAGAMDQQQHGYRPPEI